MRTKITLWIIMTLLMIASANALAVYRMDGNHILQDKTDPTSDVIGYFQQQEIWSLYDSPSAQQDFMNMTHDNGIIYVNVMYYESNLSEAISNITAECYIEPPNSINVKQTLNLLIAHSQDRIPSSVAQRKEFTLYEGENLVCEATTYWNRAYWTASGIQPPDYSGFIFAFEMPKEGTDFCADTKKQMSGEAEQFYRESSDDIGSYTKAFIMLNYKVWVIFFWIMKILLMPPVLIGVIVMVIVFFINILNNMLKKKRRRATIIMPDRQRQN
jgi:hypothetical protein